MLAPSVPRPIDEPHRPMGPVQPTLWGDRPCSVRPISVEPVRLDATSAVLHQPEWLIGADRAFCEVRSATRWRSLRRPMYDRIVDVPRLVATLQPRGLAPDSATAIIATAVTELIGADIEHIGLNLYRSGADSVAWHRDRIGDDRDWSVIALVSLGGPRQLRMRPFRPAGPAPSRAFTLRSGDLFVMAGACQRDWEHAVPKTARAAPRISLALRTKQSPQGPLLQHMGVTP